MGNVRKELLRQAGLYSSMAQIGPRNHVQPGEMFETADACAAGAEEILRLENEVADMRNAINVIRAAIGRF